MNDLRLADLNLNSLLAFDALLAEAGATRAAARLGVTQSAMSHTLRGLRDALGDPLFVRGSGGLVPTPRALALGEPVREGLAALERGLRSAADFDPATSTRRFVLALGDGLALRLGPALIARLRAEAPGVELVFRADLRDGAPDALERGETDISCVVQTPEWPGLRRRKLMTDDFVCVVRQGHPSLKGGIDLDLFARLPHLLISPAGDGPSVVDRLLAERGLARHVAVRVPTFLLAPLLIASSDLIATVPRSLARAFAASTPLQLLEPPLPVPAFSLYVLWHARLDADPGHRWLREAVIAAGQAAAAG